MFINGPRRWQLFLLVLTHGRSREVKSTGEETRMNISITYCSMNVKVRWRNADVITEEQQEAGVLERWVTGVCGGADRGQKRKKQWRYLSPWVLCHHPLWCPVHQSSFGCLLLYVGKIGLREVRWPASDHTGPSDLSETSARLAVWKGDGKGLWRHCRWLAGFWLYILGSANITVGPSVCYVTFLCLSFLLCNRIMPHLEDFGPGKYIVPRVWPGLERHVYMVAPTVSAF